jgi:hypothetical protein
MTHAQYRIKLHEQLVVPKRAKLGIASVIASDPDPPNRFGGVLLPLQQSRYVSAEPADATHCWLAFLTLTLAHCPKIVFGVLEVILRHDPITPQSFGTGKGQIAFIASMEILNIARLVADDSGRLICVGGLGSS